DRAVDIARLRRENAELRHRMGDVPELMGESAAVNQLRQSIEKVAPAESRVLISGPAGPGKEVTARLLHAHSSRRDGPFVVLNCATMAPETMETELFGTEHADGDGPRIVDTFEQADGGTL